MLNLSTKERADVIRSLQELEKEANAFQGECVEFLKLVTPHVGVTGFSVSHNQINGLIEEVSYIDTIEQISEQLAKTLQ